MIINLICLSVIVGCGYYFWVRPILKSRPELKIFYDDEAGIFSAISAKLAGIKQKLAGALVVLGGVYVEIANYVMPAMTGVDTTVWTKRLPDWVVPLIPIGLVAIFNYFRSLADKRGGVGG